METDSPTDVDISDDWGGVQGLQAHLTGDYQDWSLVSVPDNPDNPNGAYGVLKNKHTGTCLSSKGSGQYLTMAPCNTGNKNQWFWLFAL